MSMENLVLALVLLAGALAISNPLEIKLDEAPNSFDDQYQGCIPKMNQELEKIMSTEFAKNQIFNNTWAKAVKEWEKKHNPVPTTLQKEHVIALMAYSMHETLYLEFNAAVREGGRSHKEYMEKFQFKALHFLLTQAVGILQNTGGSFIPTNCHQVYRGIRNIHFTAQRQDVIRFGQFASSSLRKEKAEQFGTDTFFSVYTCYGALIRNFSVFPAEDEVLIPPFETFQVTNITKNGRSTHIQLKSKGRFSTYNCEWLKGKRRQDQPCNFSAGRTILRDLPAPLGAPPGRHSPGSRGGNLSPDATDATAPRRGKWVRDRRHQHHRDGGMGGNSIWGWEHGDSPAAAPIPS